MNPTLPTPSDMTPAEFRRRYEELLGQLEAEGSLVHFPRPPGPAVPFRQVIVQGEPLSETVVKMRRGEP